MLVAVAGACSAPGGRTGARLLGEGQPAGADLQADCALAERRCTTCHSLDRIVVARIHDPRGWQIMVERMRRMRGSLIAPAETHRIVRCLVFRSSGAAGLRELEGGAS